MEQKALDKKKAELNWGPDVSELPALSMSAVQDGVKNGKQWIVVDGFVLDVERFAPIHPGGQKLLASYYGQDATAEFKGEYYRHTNAANNLQQTMRIARVSA